MSEGTSKLQTFIHISGFSQEDQTRIRRLSEHLIPRLPALTERFYERLLADERTRPYVAPPSRA
jgi:hypothetical protein